MLKLVRRERLTLWVWPIRTSLTLVDRRAVLAAFRMLSLERESGTGAKSLTMTSLLTLV